MTLNPKVYKINRSHRLLVGKNSKSIISHIINTTFKKLDYKKSFEVESLKTIEKDNFTYFLYLFKSDEVASDWQDFLPNGLTQNENFNETKISLILFIETDDHIFCVIGGNASYQIILPFIDQSYGLNTYSRIIKPAEDELASIKSRGITGTRAGMSEQFRDNYRIIDFIKFGKIPQEIHLRLSQEISDLHFDFLKKRENDRIQVYVGKGFKIKKGVDFEILHRLIQELDIIEQLDADDYLSSYKEITDRKYIDNHLYQELITKIFNDIENLGRNRLDLHKRFQHDFSNPNDIEKFYEADEYRLKEKTDQGGYKIFKIIEDRNEIYDAVLKRAVEKTGQNDRFQFMVFLQGVKIACYQDKKLTISSNFLFHISTEFKYDGKPVFLVDTKWFHLRDSFVEDLKINTAHVLNSYPAPKGILTIPWDKTILRTEGDYNLEYNNKENYIVLDTLIADNLELCDIIYYNNEELYLIHVKYGFQSKMRELSNQVLISARRLRETKGTKEKKLLVDIYNQLLEKAYNINNLSLEQFLELFEKRIKYVIAFTSHLKKDLDVKDNIEKFSSNIARYSLIQCSGEMRASYYDLLTYQIPRV
jgi:hypothetical protein